MWGHLLMAGHLFRLLVKLRMLSLGRYALTERDEIALFATDRLLAAKDWASAPNGASSVWCQIHFEVELDRIIPIPDHEEPCATWRNHVS